LLSSSLQRVIIDAGAGPTSEPYHMVPILGALSSDGVKAALLSSSGHVPAASPTTQIPSNPSTRSSHRRQNISSVIKRSSMPHEDANDNDGSNTDNGASTPSDDIITGRRIPGGPTVNIDDDNIDTQRGTKSSAGRVIVYGDSNCMDMNHRAGAACTPLIARLLEFLVGGDDGNGYVDESIWTPSTRLHQPYRSDITMLPLRLSSDDGHTQTIAEYARYSKVVSPRARPKCGSTSHGNGGDVEINEELDHQHGNGDLPPGGGGGGHGNGNGNGNGGTYVRPTGTASTTNGKGALIRADRMMSGSGQWSSMLVYLLFALLIFIVFYLSRGYTSLLLLIHFIPFIHCVVLWYRSLDWMG
jgi:hypothetical protein